MPLCPAVSALWEAIKAVFLWNSCPTTNKIASVTPLNKWESMCRRRKDLLGIIKINSCNNQYTFRYYTGTRICDTVG